MPQLLRNILAAKVGHLLALLVASTAAAQGVPTLEGERLVGTDTEKGDLLGYCAAVADVPSAPPASGLPVPGPLAVGSAPGLQDNPLYIFQTSNGEWRQAQRIVPEQGGLFGLACAASADGVLLVVGAPGRETPPATPGNPGTAHVFRYDATTATWVDEAVIRVADLPASPRFGQSVDVARDGPGTAATEERLISIGGHDAWMLRRANAPDSVWTQEARLQPEGNDTFSGLGVEWGAPFQRAAVVRGSDGVWRAMAGSPYTLGGTYRGSAYIWRLDSMSGSWAREARFVGPSNGTCLGHSVALAEVGGVWLAAAGATQWCVGGGVGSGYVMVWHLEDGEWVEAVRLPQPDSTGLGFGSNIALAASRGGRGVLAVAPDLHAPGTGPSGVYVYELVADVEGTGTWTYVARLSTATAATPIGAGWSVAVRGATAAVGHDGEDTAGTNAGALFVYDLTSVLTAGEPHPVPTAISLDAPAPNPVHGTTRLSYALPAASDVRLTLYDAIGRLVWRRDEVGRPAGTHSVDLDASALAAGVYVLRLVTEDGDAVSRSLVVAP